MVSVDAPNPWKRAVRGCELCAMAFRRPTCVDAEPGKLSHEGMIELAAARRFVAGPEIARVNVYENCRYCPA